jgi:co-chaperonin GroES (HSP10)
MINNKLLVEKLSDPTESEGGIIFTDKPDYKVNEGKVVAADVLHTDLLDMIITYSEFAGIKYRYMNKDYYIVDYGDVWAYRGEEK